MLSQQDQVRTVLAGFGLVVLWYTVHSVRKGVFVRERGFRGVTFYEPIYLKRRTEPIKFWIWAALYGLACLCIFWFAWRGAV
jgi:hypothetical protein